MSKWMSVFALGAALVLVGCHHHDKESSTTQPKKMTTESCSKCPAKTASADASCPVEAKK